jgi:ribose transport system ATP-binding protein
MTPSSAIAAPAGTSLSFSGVSKIYGSTQALDSVGFDVRPGQIHALLGGNGSGKSTLIKILAGVEAGEGHGQISVGESTVSDAKTSPEWARDNHIRFVHQDLGLFENLTVAENLLVGAAFPHRNGVVNWRDIAGVAQELIDEFGIKATPQDTVADLRPAQKTLVAVARALRGRRNTHSGFLVLDEPTASLPAAEADSLLQSLRQLRDQGQAIIYVSHRLDEILDISDTLTVLRDGRVMADRPTEGLTKADLIQLIAGRQISSVFPDHPPRKSGELLTVDGLTGGPLVDVSIKVAPGEVLGIAGLVGSGRTSLLQMLFGLHPHTSGSIKLSGKVLQPAIASSIKQGLAYVPEDRSLDGAFGNLSVSVNAAAGHDSEYFTGSYRHRSERSFASAIIQRLAVRTAGPEAPVGSLSGGNQQKVMIGRWLRPSTRVLLLDEPTQGVDVGARSDIYQEIGRLREEGLGIILVSSDEEELLGLSDTIVVLRRGRVAAVRNWQEANATWLSHEVHGITVNQIGDSDVQSEH